MDDISQLIKQLKYQFNINNINDYQNLILIIYNSLFIYEDQLTPQIKYELFNLLNIIIDKIELQKHNPLLNTSSLNLYDLLVFDKIKEINIKDDTQ